VARTAVITGASSGIGEALAHKLASRGWHCVLLARREDRLRGLAAAVGGEYEVCDVADREAVEAAAQRILARHAQIDLLVNNAGIAGRSDFLTIEPERARAVMDVNYFGTLWCLRAFLPGLQAAESGQVVNVVSVAGHVAWGASGPYSASKHAQLALSRGVTQQLAGRGIRVHTVNPGFVETEGFPQREIRRRKLIGRVVIRPQRVADHILDAIEHDRRETFVPAWYRVFAVAQALLPGVVGRIAGGSKP
jgi:short-subunit dehydrogenase